MHGHEGACRAGSPSGWYIVLLTLYSARPASAAHAAYAEGLSL